jgi:hypothetical protein
MTTNAGKTTPGSSDPAASRSGNGRDKGGVISGIQETVAMGVDKQKAKAAQGLGSIADVIHQAGDGLRSENEALASMVDTASTQLKQFADHIRTRGAGDLMEDVAAFGRRRPAVFVGGALLIGLGLARFLKSSAPDTYEQGYMDRDEQSYMDRDAAAFGDTGQY